MSTPQGITMAVKADEATIAIVGTIGWDVWGERLRNMMAEIPAEVATVRFRIYSYGGDVWEGNDIISAIAGLTQRTVADVQVAASMATLIACSCDEVRMAANGRYLIHNPWTAAAGDAAEFEKRAKELRDTEAEAVALYACRTGKTGDELRALMGEERWLTAEEAKALGFVDAIDDPYDLAGYKEATKAMVAASQIPAAMVAYAMAEPEGSTDDGTTTDGATGDGQGGTDGGDGAGAGDDTTALPPEALAHLAAIEQRLSARAESAYQDGLAAGRAEVTAACEASLSALRAELDAERAARSSEAAAYHVSDAASRGQVAEYERRLASLAGGLAFREHKPGRTDNTETPESWEDAVALYGYSKARRQFPELYESYMTTNSK